MNAATIKTNKGARFYNPGDRLSEPLNYSIEGADIHCVARYTIEAGEREFFNVPTEIKFLNEGTRKAVDFPTTVCQKFKDRGLIMIDDEIDQATAEDDSFPFARTEEEAREKGDRIWIQYLWTIVRRHQSLCAEIKVKGGIPEPAQGFTKRALKLLSMQDPAVAGQQAIQAEQVAPPSENQKLRALEEDLRSTQEMLAKVLGRLEAKEQADASDAVEAVSSRRTRASR